MPPSKDENRPRRNNLRKKTQRKPGGQKGHKGITLEMTKPCIVEKLEPCFCEKCGNNLDETQGEFIGRRQVLDLPPIKPVVTEYQTYSKKCECGHETTSDFPLGVKSPVSYGCGIQGVVAYLHARHYVPFLRMKELVNDLFGLSISEGGIDLLLKKFEKKSQSFYQKIIDKIQSSPVIGSDETGCKVNGETNWFWTWQNAQYTFIHASDNRAKKTIDNIFPNGFPESCLISDCWNPQLNTIARTHQICTAHLLRETKYLIQLYEHDWAKAFQKLLLDAINVKANMTLDDYSICGNVQVGNILDRFDNLLNNYNQTAKFKKLNTFVKRMVKLKDYLFTFLFNPEVTPDNNASERAIRNVKVKLKVSGQFKSKDGAKRFAVIRSIIDTFIKNKCSIWDSMRIIANGNLFTTE